jgi:hypothetical protein
MQVIEVMVIKVIRVSWNIRIKTEFSFCSLYTLLCWDSLHATAYESIDVLLPFRTNKIAAQKQEEFPSKMNVMLCILLPCIFEWGTCSIDSIYRSA